MVAGLLPVVIFKTCQFLLVFAVFPANIFTMFCTFYMLETLLVDLQEGNLVPAFKSLPLYLYNQTERGRPQAWRGAPLIRCPGDADQMYEI